MAYLRRQPVKTLWLAELSQSSAEVSRLQRLLALHLPNSYSRMRLLHTSRFVRTTQFAFGSRPKSCRISSGRIAKAIRSSSTGQRKYRVKRRADVKSTDQPLLNPKQIVTPQSGQNILVRDGFFVDNLFEKLLTVRACDDITMTIFQPLIVPETTSSPIKRVFTSSFCHDGDLGGVAHPLTHSFGKSSVVSSLGHTYSQDEETRAQSQVTVAAQQRAEAAYRRQRMAQEREQTAVLRAEMEVERARMLKEMTCGSRRPSYCLELENLKEEAPDDVRKNLEECLKDYSTVDEKNARNSLPNEYPRSAVIMRSESKDETGANQNNGHQSQESDENENLERRSSTLQSSDKDLCLNVEQQPSLQTGIIGSLQAFPSSIRNEENKENRGYLGNEKPRRRSGVEQILAMKGRNEKIIQETSQETDGPQKRKRNEEVSIVQDSNTNQNHTFRKKVVDSEDVTAVAKDDSVAISGENPTVQDDSVKVTSPDGSVPISETTSDVDYASGDTHPVAVTENVNEEQTSLETKDTNDEGEPDQHLKEKSENAANGIEQSQTVIKESTGQNAEKIESSHANMVLSENVDRNAGTENDKNEQFDQLRETTLEGK